MTQERIRKRTTRIKEDMEKSWSMFRKAERRINVHNKALAHELKRMQEKCQHPNLDFGVCSDCSKIVHSMR